MLIRPRLAPAFPPGHAYATFQKAMIEGLQTQAVADVDGELTYPLADIQLGSSGDLVAGLIGAWAAVGEVLVFYQDRIASEGYLRTAVEDRSVAELARSIGYEPTPGLAAGVPLAFRVGPASGLDELTIPAGTRVQSLPGPNNKRPQVFETIAPLEVRTEWTDLRALLPAAAASEAVPAGATEVYLADSRPRLTPGDRLLLMDQSGRTWYVRTVTAVEQAATRTRVAWAEPIGPDALAGPAAFVLRVRARLFGWDAPAWSDLPASSRRKLAPLVGGLSLTPTLDGGQAWTQAPGGGTAHDVRALLIDANGIAFAATALDGVLCSLDGGRNWQPANLGLTRRDGHALALDEDGNLFAGTVDGGVFRSADAGASWEPFQTRTGIQLGRQGLGVASSSLPRTVVRALAVYRDPRTAATTVLAGTDQGVFRTLPGGDGWEPANEGLPNDVAGSDVSGIAVVAIAQHPPSDRVYIGTRRGVYTSVGRGTRWSAANGGFPGPVPVRSLVAFADARGQWAMLAATSSGLFRTGLPTVAWTRIGGDQTWYSLTVAPDGSAVYAATSTGVWRSTDAGLSWQHVSAGLSSLEVRSVAAGPGGALVAAGPLDARAGDEWAGFEVEGMQVDLERIAPQVKPGGWLVIASDAAAGLAPLGLCSVRGTERVHAAAFGRRASVTRVTTAEAVPAGVSRRQALILAGSEPLPLAPAEVHAVVSGESVTLAARLDRPPLAGRTLALSGKTVQGEAVAEIVRLASVDADPGGTTRMTFRSTLAYAYDAATLHINANVAPATHGESVTEVVGSGDYAQAFQQFTLRRTPLTRYSLPADASPSVVADPVVALSVTVNGVEWQPVESLLGYDGRSQVYILKQDADGSVTLTFGDGTTGARLPTGTENVVAVYRAGAGTDGNLPADSLIQLLTRPLGVRGVTNPVPATGAEDAEPTRQVRLEAPRDLRRVRRIVSLNDYAAFARDAAGIDKAIVRLLQVRARRIVHLTVASSDTDATPAAVRGVQATVQAVQASHQRVQVDVCRRRTFSIAADISVERQTDPSLVSRAAVAALEQAFSFAARDLAQPVSAAEVVQTLQSVPGVVSVDLTGLAYADQPSPVLRTSLSAEEAHWDSGQNTIVPAELLELGSADLHVAQLA